MTVVIADSKCVEIKEKNKDEGVKMSKEENENFLISLAEENNTVLTPEQISKAIRILIEYNFGWKIREKKKMNFLMKLFQWQKKK